MVDTAEEANATSADLDVTVAPVPAPMPDSPACTSALARAALCRALAIGLTAAAHAGRYRWEGTFRISHAIEQAAWDVLTSGVQAPGATTEG